MPGALVTDDPGEASRLANDGTPVVLVGQDAATLGAVVAASVAEAADRQCAHRLLAVMVGAPGEPATAGAAREMAAELWPPAAGKRC